MTLRVINACTGEEEEITLDDESAKLLAKLKRSVINTFAPQEN